MVVAYVLFAFLTALLFTGILVAVLGWRRPGREDSTAALLFIFFILFFGVWAGSVWIPPTGPLIWNIAWVPIVVVGFILSLLIAALVPPRRTITANAPAEVGLSAFFWFLLLVLLIAGVVGSLGSTY